MIEQKNMWYAWKDRIVHIWKDICLHGCFLLCVCTHRSLPVEIPPQFQESGRRLQIKADIFFPASLSFHVSSLQFWFWKVNVNIFVKLTVPQAALLKYFFCSLSDLLSGIAFFPLLGIAFHLDGINHLSHPPGPPFFAFFLICFKNIYLLHSLFAFITWQLWFMPLILIYRGGNNTWIH